MGAFSSCGELGYSVLAVHELLTAVTFIADHGLQWLWRVDSVVAGCKLSCPLTCEIFSDQGIEPMSSALAGEFFTTGLPGRSM